MLVELRIRHLCPLRAHVGPHDDAWIHAVDATSLTTLGGEENRTVMNACGRQLSQGITHAGSTQKLGHVTAMLD